MSIGCMSDVVYRFVNAAADDEALAVDTQCVKGIPRPTVIVPITAPSGPSR
jgi:hypothetical protein